MKNFTLFWVAVFGISTTALADSVNIHSFSSSTNPSYTLTEDTMLGTDWNRRTRDVGHVFFHVVYDRINDPLVELSQDQQSRTDTIVSGMNTLSITGAYTLSPSLMLGASSGLSLVQKPNIRSQVGLVDSRLFAKVKLNKHPSVISFALMPELAIPTGTRSLFLSNDGFGGGLRFMAERDFGGVQVAANIGYQYAPNAVYRDLSMRNTMPMSLSALIPVGPRWAINAETSGILSLPVNADQNPSLFYVGAKYRLPQDIQFSFGGAVGAFDGDSSANYHVLAGITFTPSPVRPPKPAPVLAPVVVVAPVVEKPKPVVAAVVAKPVRVTFTAKELVITEEVKFGNGKAWLTKSGKNLLDEVAKVLKENKLSYKLVVIEGHTNNIGTYKFNQRLSEQRAAAVKEYLRSRGIPAKAMLTVGYGKAKAKKVSGLSKEAELEANRRVAFKIVQ